jgi:hypothetical protein
MLRRRRIVYWSILVLTLEKVFQHLVTAALFVVDVPGLGRPDIGRTFRIPGSAMAVLNAVIGMLFALGFVGSMLDKAWCRSLLIGLAVFDVLAEFVFHATFRITVSVVVGVLLLVLIRVATASSKA